MFGKRIVAILLVAVLMLILLPITNVFAVSNITWDVKRVMAFTNEKLQ